MIEAEPWLDFVFRVFGLIDPIMPGEMSGWCISVSLDDGECSDWCSCRPKSASDKYFFKHIVLVANPPRSLVKIGNLLRSTESLVLITQSPKGGKVSTVRHSETCIINMEDTTCLHTCLPLR